MTKGCTGWLKGAACENTKWNKNYLNFTH